MNSFEKFQLHKEKNCLENAFKNEKNLLIEAPTGSGKSLYIPWLLAQNFSGKIVVLEPKRLAALSLAKFSAKLLNEPCGKSVGYQFRQNALKSEHTRILYQTYGNFLQEILHGKCDAEWVLFDEFHERKADMDLLLSFFKAENKTRVIVMSASFNAYELENYLQTKTLKLGTPLHPVEIIHQNALNENLEDNVLQALKNLYRNNVWETILVFLPGKSEIKRARECAEEQFRHVKMYELFAGQSTEIQDEIFTDTSEPRIIFTTNIAETSLTVPHVSGVIDSGVEKTSLYDESKDIDVLRLQQISLQNAVQRSGRAGRTQKGICIRLWNKNQEAHFEKGIIPEVLQMNVLEFILQQKALEFSLQKELELLTKIPEKKYEKALNELEKLQLICDEKITEKGLKISHAPIQNIRLSSLLFLNEKISELSLWCIAWIFAGGEFLQKNKTSGNLLELILENLEHSKTAPLEVRKTFDDLKNFCKKNLKENDEVETIKMFIRIYGDKISFLQSENKGLLTYKLKNNQLLRLPLKDSFDCIIPLLLLQVQNKNKVELGTSLYLPFSKNLIENAPEKKSFELIWKNSGERFYGVILTENSRKEIPIQEAREDEKNEFKKLTSKYWKEKIEKENWRGKFFTEPLEKLLAKMKLAFKFYPDYNFPEFNDEDFELIDDEFFNGIFNLKDLTEERYRKIIEEYFGSNMLTWLHRSFPDFLTLPNGKKARYYYEREPVEISARIEDFMGLKGEHFIAENKLKVRYDILAPNFRTAQKTWDLTGFWKNTYKEIRKELRGRYPKHPWPEEVL